MKGAIIMTPRTPTPFPSRRAFAAGMAAALALGGARLGVSAQGGSSPASPSATADTFEINGEVARPGPLSVADIQALPAETVDVTYLTDDGTEVQHTYTGARFWDVLQLAEPTIEPERPETSLQKYVVLTAADGYIVVLSMGEIDPEFGGNPYLLAWDEDGQPLPGERSPAMLVLPGDHSEGRYVWSLVSIDVRSVEAGAGA
jgi:DMSO/TMAO reductase YedYZ molybdopterin-dependent catalytic subunit